jgi:glycosyltransferase involved in cell wall biosynthesis
MPEKHIASMVSVLCTAYNHEAFIEKSLLGMLNQKTSFSYEIIVHDDASTDGTRLIIEKYQQQFPDKIKPIFQQENQFSKGRKIWTEIMLPEASGKYIAICDGDDWWTDENKLQEQIDFLENNEEYSICWTGYEVNDGEKTKPAEWLNEMHADEDIDEESAFHPYRTYTLTAVMRKDSIDAKIYNSLRFHKDNSLYAICLRKGRGRLMKRITGIYNMHSGGIFSKKTEQYKAINSYLNFNEISTRIFLTKNKSVIKLRNYFLKESIILTSFRINRVTFMLLKDALLLLPLNETGRLLWSKIRYR